MPGWDTSALHEDWQEDYERGRPGWPRAALDAIDLPAPATVAEVGASTGKLTRLLVARYARVLAVEPDEGMRRLLRRTAPDAEIVEGSAEAISLPDASIDALFAAEAFHVFDGEPAALEFARVLKPGGVLVLLWNVPSRPTDVKVTSASALVRSRAPGGLAYDPADLNTTRYASGAWRQAFANAPFGEFTDERISNPQQVDSAGLLAFFASMGWLSELPDDARRSVLDDVAALLPAGEYHRTWETRLHRTTRLG